MKNVFKILSIIAVLSLIVLQYFIISGVYNTLSQNLLTLTDDNPYSTFYFKMFLLVLTSSLIIVFVIYCFIRVWKMLSKVTRESNMRREHTYAMIHDMKTPLSAINLVAQDIEENVDISQSADIEQDVRILKEECTHLNQICEMVIKVAKLESDKLQFVFEDIVLKEFMEGVCEKFRGQTKVDDIIKDVEIEIHIEPSEKVNADRLYLTEIVNNIIDNSIKYSKENVKISVTSRRFVQKSLVNMPGIERLNIWPHKKFRELVIADNGIGISEKTKNILFSKFERGENTVEISGHGIGLHYVYQLMNMMGGYIKIESAEGKGTSVILGFPED